MASPSSSQFAAVKGLALGTALLGFAVFSAAMLTDEHSFSRWGLCSIGVAAGMFLTILSAIDYSKA